MTRSVLPRPGRLLLIAVALAALTAACAQLARAAGASPDDVLVTIVPPDGGAERTLTRAQLAAAEDVHDRRYTVRDADLSTRTVTVADGVSVSALLRAAGVEEAPWRHAVVGESGLLLEEDLNGTEEGPPVLWSDERGVHFLRPSGGDADVNASDLADAPDGALTLRLRTDDPVKPLIWVSVLRARPHQPVRFRASLAVGVLRPGWGFEWYFDGTGIEQGANVMHRFPEPAKAHVLLNVVRADGTGVGLPDTVDLRIAWPRRASERRRAPRDEGAAGSSAAETGGGGAGTTSGTGGASGGATTRDRTAGRPAASAPDRAATPVRPVASRDPIVSGTLLAAADAGPALTPTEAAAGAPATATSASTADDEPDRPLDVPVGAWVAIGLAALLALGWALESRYTPPFWQP